MSIAQNFPNLKPSLLLDFANTKALDPRITYARASAATYYNANGLLESAAAGEARFDHNPVTGESLGLLIEESRTNLLLQSGFAGAVAGAPGTAPTSWVFANSGGVIENVFTDTIGQNTIRVSASANRQALQQTISVAANTSIYCSVFVVSNSGLAVNQLIAVFNLPTGATASYLINGIAVANPNAAVPVAGDRIAVLVIVSTTAGTGLFRVGVGVSGNSTGSHAFKWPQVEVGAFPTSYIPTTTAQVTRAADAASMTGANFSSWYNQSEGTIYVEADMYETQFSFFRNLLAINDASGSSVNTVVFNIPSNNNLMRFTVNSANVTSASLQQSLTLGSAFKAAGAYKTDDFAVSFNAETPLTDTSGNVPNGVNTLVFGSINHTLGVQSHSSTHYKRFAYYPKRIANDQLQGLTT